MATNNRESNVQEESSPLLSKQFEENQKDAEKPAKASPEKSPTDVGNVNGGGNGCVWTADGLPLGHGSVMGEPMGRAQWDSSILACLGRNDEFCSSDLEVCLLGSVAPCVLYGSNAERLGSAPGTFANHCLPYSALYLIGNTFFGWNCLAPWFSYPRRTAIRRKFNLEGSCEALNRSCGCCGSFMDDEQQKEQCETACDFATHVFCHPCALCQEGREIRRRLPHPGFNAQPVLVMIPPVEQAMGRGA
ncbi:cell number regulator 8 [Pyrus x bretschneideri]|uniref:cell number regulator 8 n=1 Tax=Pyrus x bretschneideri TaxID=225117 RepID=UPI000511730B|nr:cell number regulator 8 [Pyrus x bretschneideri]